MSVIDNVAFPVAFNFTVITSADGLGKAAASTLFSATAKPSEVLNAKEEVIPKPPITNAPPSGR